MTIDPKTCGNCRYWSEMCAQAIGGGPIEAMCLSQTGPHHQKFTRETQHCDQWASNHFGAIDAPPNYGEAARAAYEAEGSGVAEVCPTCQGEGNLDEPVGHLFKQCPDCEGTGEARGRLS